MNKKITQIITVIFLAASFLLIWQIANIYPDINILKDKISVQESTVANSKDILKRTEDLVVFINRNKADVDKFDFILPINEDKANLLSSIDSLARSSNLTIANIVFDEKKDGSKNSKQDKTNSAALSNDVITNKIKISASGTYMSFKSFLNSVEKNLRVWDVSSVDFARVTQSNTFNNENEMDDIPKEEIKMYFYNIELINYLYVPSKTENITRLLSSGKFVNFSVKDLNFTKEEVFKSLQIPDAYNIDSNIDEVSGSDVF